MPAQPRGLDEVSAGGVVLRPSADTGWEACLVRAGTRWGLPKGHLEPGETVVAAALREITEETGIELRHLTTVAELPASRYTYRHAGRLHSKVVHHFLFTVPPGIDLRPDPAEIDEAAWLGRDDAIARASFADTVAILREAYDLASTQH